MSKRLKGLKAWLPSKTKGKKCFFGTDLSKDWKDGWNDGRKGLNDHFGTLSLLERIKIAFRGYIIK